MTYSNFSEEPYKNIINITLYTYTNICSITHSLVIKKTTDIEEIINKRLHRKLMSRKRKRNGKLRKLNII
jgi:hypothetical protein